MEEKEPNKKRNWWFIGAYAIVYPFQFAIGVVMMILIHEIGHVIAAKLKGLPVTAPVFIPFLGALITMKKNPKDAVTEAYCFWRPNSRNNWGIDCFYFRCSIRQSHFAGYSQRGLFS
jgi:hypothetical protein